MKRPTLMTHDLVGGLVTAAALAAGVYGAISAVSTTRLALAQAKREHADVSQRMNQIASELAQKKTALEEFRSELESRGALPQQSEFDADLQRIARLARSNAVEILDVTPAPRRQFPKITETRYTFVGSGSFRGLMGMLHDFEEESFWADVTELQVVQKSGADASDELRSARFVVSLFSTQSESVDTDKTR